MQYFDHIRRLLDEVERTQSGAIETVAERMSEAILAHHSIYVFGASHAGILAEELYYRAGGLMVINPIFGLDLSLSSTPITHTSRMERLEGYGSVLAQKVKFAPGDILIVHSVSGRNPVAIDLAIDARAAGAYVVCLTSMQYTTSVTSKHSSGKRLFEVADLTIDNCGIPGDAVCEITGMQQKVSPSSTVIGATILNTIVSMTVQKLVDKGMDFPPVFYSANQDGGDELNRALFDKYKNEIHYTL